MSSLKSILEEIPTRHQLIRACACYEKIIRENLRFIIERYKANDEYPWINTKVSLITRQDYSADDIFKGKEIVYSWIQGRGLEAISEILRKNSYFGTLVPEENVKQARSLLKSLLEQMYRVWKQNNRHFSFMMSSDGKPVRPVITNKDKNEKENRIVFETFRIEATAKYTISDIFCAEGLLSAALYLNQNDIAREAVRYCLDIYESAFELTKGIENDQFFFDSANPAIPQTGKISHTPFMLLIGMMSILSDYTDVPKIDEMSLKLINRIVERHINIANKWPELKEYDFVEAIDATGHPYREDGKILSDPGHALEFVGLSMKLLNSIETHSDISAKTAEQIRKLQNILVNVLFRNFENGFVKEYNGICKSVNLVTRKKVNPEMPWWSLPETMRSAMFLWARKSLTDKAHNSKLLKIFSACHNAFLENYVIEDFYMLAIQSRDEQGRASNKIPAIPDIDPCYHTCLSLLDCIEIISTSLK